ncbi:DM13 domain-containing protein [Catenovulum sp. SM1970]|uniref:DM13 domain-containing protein n=1 Tax=Marinifaba aquimaris TaxID=2741323 RepID=UPI001573B2E7|nr:DM13 domain-containing protein [Marinifaba aquimaris]NTS78181.1 DM13 domain-containing protein [Marinifaba aquimaris]
MMFKNILCAISIALLSFNGLAGDRVIAKGEFKGMSGHVAKGDVTITKGDNGYTLKFADNFWFDGAPDPRLGFGHAKYWPKTEFAKLTHLRGEKEYQFPLSSELENYQTFWIWCEAFSVPIGQVNLKI